MYEKGVRDFLLPCFLTVAGALALTYCALAAEDFFSRGESAAASSGMDSSYLHRLVVDEEEFVFFRQSSFKEQPRYSKLRTLIAALEC